MRLLARARARSEPRLMRRRVEQAWRLHWYGIILAPQQGRLVLRCWVCGVGSGPMGMRLRLTRSRRIRQRPSVNECHHSCVVRDEFLSFLTFRRKKKTFGPLSRLLDPRVSAAAFAVFVAVCTVCAAFAVVFHDCAAAVANVAGPLGAFRDPSRAFSLCFFFFERTLKTIHHTLSQNCALPEQQTCRPSRSKINTGEPPVVHDVVHTRCFAICATWTPSLQQ